MTTLIATSVVRGSIQGESHGGVYLLNITNQRSRQVVDWNTMDIEWQGRGWDRGLRGIAFDDDRVFIAASDELFVYDPHFTLIASYKNPYLKHCHEIYRYKRRLFLTSTGFAAILGFDLDQNRFSWGLSVSKDYEGLRGQPFHPEKDLGPPANNILHLNSVFCNSSSMYFSGLHSGGLFAYSGRHIKLSASLPDGTHNARPHKNGILYNDTGNNTVRFISRDGEQRTFAIPQFDAGLLTNTDQDDSRTARQAFGRGLCSISDDLIAAGSSPSTVSLHSFDSVDSTVFLNLTMDIRNAIHGLEVWPFDPLNA